MEVLRLEEASLIDTQNPKTVFNTLIVDDKDYLLNRDNLTQPIQMQLYQKQKIFSKFFSSISKIYIKFGTYAEKSWPS